MKFSLVIPCYNEAANLSALIQRCAQIPLSTEHEIILVDNGSTDDTPNLLASLLGPHMPQIRSIRVSHNQGYGFGILSGLRAAHGDVLGWTHADLQTDPQDAWIGLSFFATHGPAIFVKGRRIGRPWGDRFFTACMSLFETVLLKTPLRDINAQPTLFSRTFFEGWVDPPHDFSLDLFAYYQAQIKSLSVLRFPVRFDPRQHGVSHWNTSFANKLKFIRRTLSFSLQLNRRVKSWNSSRTDETP